MSKKIVSYILLFLILPVIIVVGTFIFNDKQYAFVSLAVAGISCVPFFLSFEKRNDNTKKLIIVAIMIALTVISRIVFAPIPGFKPVTAMIIITAIYLGGEAGFITGAMTAVISNFYFGQGPWTPIQMFVWGLIGLLAGIFASGIKKSKVIMIIYGIFSGVVFSFLMDVWTVVWWDGSFNFSRFLVAIISAGWFTLLYAISNVIFLLLLAKPIGKKLDRIKSKYEI